ncbi:hypothetical protein Pcinc_017959 [Petrolisthes cinctipes]|uniref:Uncharacterized protein n=1 Tax=Petrolisthes cinctipes TaxID=88211 RepID=A0AAE1FT63_PETCI|nr:hypothetical protein Pcinc_017959 [Petrolisthes cinctipes]
MSIEEGSGWHGFLRLKNMVVNAAVLASTALNSPTPEHLPFPCTTSFFTTTHHNPQTTQATHLTPCPLPPPPLRSPLSQQRRLSSTSPITFVSPTPNHNPVYLPHTHQSFPTTPLYPEHQVVSPYNLTPSLTFPTSSLTKPHWQTPPHPPAFSPTTAPPPPQPCTPSTLTQPPVPCERPDRFR